MRFVALALIGCVFAGAAHAEDSAVSALNGKFSLEGGATGSGGDTARSSAVGTAQGAIATPLGAKFGAQLDGMVSDSYGSLQGGGGLHVFWRDPAIGLAGPIAAVGGGHGATIGLYGGEGEFYGGSFTLGAAAGYQSVTSPYGAVPSGGFWLGRLTFYPISDLALAAGGGQMAGVGVGSATIEYQPDFIQRRSASLFVDGDIGDNGYYRITSGVRFYFGPEKTLIRRHREDDPALNVGSIINSISNNPNIDIIAHFGGPTRQ